MLEGPSIESQDLSYNTSTIQLITTLTKCPVLVLMRTTSLWTFIFDFARACCAYKVIFSLSSLDGERSPIGRWKSLAEIRVVNTGDISHKWPKISC